MLRPFTVAALAAVGVLLMVPRADAGLLLTDVTAVVSGSPVNATALHGYIDGNDTDPAGGNSKVLRLLNSGTNAGDNLELMPGSVPFTISSTGMFSTNTAGPSIFDCVVFETGFTGFTPNQPWEYVGKTNFATNGSSQNNPNDPTSPFTSAALGTLTFENSPLAAGSYVLTLKAGSQYSVYLFANMGEISSFTYSNLPSDVSHATLIRAVGPAGHLPEPTSLAVFGFGALLGVGGSLRRRFANRK